MRETTPGNDRRLSTRTCISYLRSVVENLRLADGTLFPIPITLDVSKADIERLSIAPGMRFALRDPRDDEALAIITGGLGFRVLSM